MADINFEEMLKKITDNPDIMSKISQISKSDGTDSITDKIPDVIATISPLLNGNDGSKSDTESEITDTPADKIEQTSIGLDNQMSLPIARLCEKISKNSKLLLALKPYLSKQRSDAVDSIIKMAQVADLMKLMR